MSSGLKFTHRDNSIIGGAEITDASQVGLDITGSLTCLAWFRPFEISRIHTIASKYEFGSNNRGWFLSVHSTNELRFVYSEDGTAVNAVVSGVLDTVGPNAPYRPHHWIHVGAVFISGTPAVQFYVNGAAFGAPVAITGPGTIFDTPGAFTVGNLDQLSPASTVNQAVGMIDKLKVYDDERTGGEIATEYTLDPVAGANLQAGYAFEDLTDISGNANTLTLFGGATLESEENAEGRTLPTPLFSANGGNQNAYNASAFAEVTTVIPPDVTAPQIENITPAPGVAVDVDEPITFDVTDETDLAFVAILVSFGDGSVFVAHDGDAFRGEFQGATNQRTVIAGGFRYTLLKDGGWYDGNGDASAPTFEYLALDRGGNLGVVA